MTRTPQLALALALALLAGCRAHTPVDNAANAYADGEFQDALDDLDRGEDAYRAGELDPAYELRFIALQGLARYRLSKELNDKGHRRKARPLVNRALDRWNGTPKAKEEKWLDDAIARELEEAGKDFASAPGARVGGGPSDPLD